jgi:pyruvate formate lyase activating enzyme
VDRVREASRLCKKEGFFTIFVSNGYIEERPLRDLKGLVDATNIDVKGFTEEFYKKVCKASLAPVLRSVEVALEIGLHVELTYLIIPGKNDSKDEIGRFCQWVAQQNAEVPVHFSRFHPDYKMMDAPPTPMATMDMAYQEAKANGLMFVYLGNVRSDKEDTVCPNCGAISIRRSLYDISLVHYENGKCSKCGRELNIVP